MIITLCLGIFLIAFCFGFLAGLICNSPKL
jgi:hypothetical protein